MRNILDQLARPFPEGSIHWRPGSTNAKKIQRETGDKYAKPTKGIPLAYIDARDVMERLDDVVGPDMWQCRYPFPGCCEIGIYNAEIEQWLWRANGAGATDIEGEKGQYSDAFKRAGVLWGIGRYLYDLPNTWEDMNEYGKFKSQPKLPGWATPSGWNRIASGIKREVYEQTMDALSRGDEMGLKQVWEEFDNEEKIQLWPMFDSKERSAIKALST